MSYDENRISDQIEGGLLDKENSIRIDYAIYGKMIDKNPLIRFKTLKEAKDAYLENEYAMIVTEVSEVQKDGTLLIKQERIIKCPQIWLPNNFIPEFDDDYLCYITRKYDVTGKSNWQEVIPFNKGNWQISNELEVVFWMIVEDPIYHNDHKGNRTFISLIQLNLL